MAIYYTIADETGVPLAGAARSAGFNTAWRTVQTRKADIDAAEVRPVCVVRVETRICSGTRDWPIANL